MTVAIRPSSTPAHFAEPPTPNRTSEPAAARLGPARPAQLSPPIDITGGTPTTRVAGGKHEPAHARRLTLGGPAGRRYPEGVTRSRASRSRSARAVALGAA